MNNYTLKLKNHSNHCICKIRVTKTSPTVAQIIQLAEILEAESIEDSRNILKVKRGKIEKS